MFSFRTCLDEWNGLFRFSFSYILLTYAKIPEFQNFRCQNFPEVSFGGMESASNFPENDNTQTSAMHAGLYN